MRHVRVLLGVVWLLAGSSRGLAQSATGPHAAPDRTWEVEPYIGVARHSPAGSHLGVTPDRDHLFAGMHATGAILRWRGFTLAYAPEVVPLLLLTDTPTYHREALPGVESHEALVVDGSGVVAGVGASPVGFEARVRFGPHLRLYAATAAGVVLFTRDTPVPGARALNFTFEVGGGVDVRVRSGWWLRLGYKFHHLSNAQSAAYNPGVDAKVVMAGLSHAVGRR